MVGTLPSCVSSVALDPEFGDSTVVFDESNSHIIISLFFINILRLNVQNNAKLWSLHPKLCFLGI